MTGTVGRRPPWPDPLRIRVLPPGGTKAPRFRVPFSQTRALCTRSVPLLWGLATSRSRPPRWAGFSWGFKPEATSRERVQVVHAASTFLAAQGPQDW